MLTPRGGETSVKELLRMNASHSAIMAASHWGECGPEMASSYEFGVGMDGFSEKLRVGASARSGKRWQS
ncbi:hypothetical protein CLOM_g12095 [Closterium sp. NIES-68]|nr:hypothetical protein CLOM_g12095 [Closterium sp. NIES-68]GJP81902.1 hypothetical protein CLOP_g12035 [Closterium sp. NIES-67]GJP86858.1 hypothetical protein CLOP_g16832 [Closterium sp. NIES-67]